MRSIGWSPNAVSISDGVRAGQLCRCGLQATGRRLGQRNSICPRIDPQVAKDPSRLIAANEHQLRMLIAGSGGPTIVLEDGIGNGIEL
jgi:hypothetical protein